MAFLFRYILHHSCLVLTAACIAVMVGSIGPALRSSLAAEGKSTRAENIDTAREQFKRGQYTQCIESAQKAIEEETYRSKRQWWILMVESLMAQGRYDQAAKEIDTALLRYTVSIRLLKLGHTANLYSGQTDYASEMLAKIYRYGRWFKIEYWPSNAGFRLKPAVGGPPDLVALGEALLLLGSEPRIVLEQLFNRAMRIDPNCRQAYLAAGALALDKQDYDPATLGSDQNPPLAGLLISIIKLSNGSVTTRTCTAVWPGHFTIVTGFQWSNH